MDWDAKARALILGTVAISRADEAALVPKLAQALREADQRGYERGVREAAMAVAKMELRVFVNGQRQSDYNTGPIVANIRALAPEREGK